MHEEDGGRGSGSLSSLRNEMSAADERSEPKKIAPCPLGAASPQARTPLHTGTTVIV